MANYFVSPDDLTAWVKSRPSADDAAKQIMNIIGNGKPLPEEDSIVDSCRSILSQDEGVASNASSVLFGVLAKHNLTNIEKNGSMEKLAQNMPSQSRQRNGWVRGMRNKWNRVVDGFNDGTPWRVDRDKMYDFTHYYTDDIKFDEDPERVYSGEAIWRAFIMDKYSRESQDKDGHWVGGYINNRFYVFPDAGTPANPNVPRDGGNQMGLAWGEKSRKPRPHQWSIERRLEDARGGDVSDMEVTTATSVKPIAKIASVNLPEERHQDKIYNIFRDTIEMREAGFNYDDMLVKIADHYDVSITGVAQIDLVAQNLLKKHDGIFYGLEKTANNMFQIPSDIPAIDVADNREIMLGGSNGSQVVKNPDGNTFHVVDGDFAGHNVSIQNQNVLMPVENIQDAADEVGLNETTQPNQPNEINELNNNTMDVPTDENLKFPVQEV